jgi:hypothetical protein
VPIAGHRRLRWNFVFFAVFRTKTERCLERRRAAQRLE